MLYIRYRYTSYTIELIVDRMEVGLGGSSLYLVYTHSLYRAFLVPTRVIIDYYSWGCIRLVYAIGIRL
jgi:hypothetical protein